MRPCVWQGRSRKEEFSQSRLRFNLFDFYKYHRCVTCENSVPILIVQPNTFPQSEPARGICTQTVRQNLAPRPPTPVLRLPPATPPTASRAATIWLPKTHLSFSCSFTNSLVHTSPWGRPSALSAASVRSSSVPNRAAETPSFSLFPPRDSSSLHQPAPMRPWTAPVRGTLRVAAPRCVLR